jgi:hypothetical protein
MLSLPLPACALLFAAAAVAAPPDPSLASAPVPPVTYHSVLAGYRPFADDKPTPWRQANDAAAGVGGWRVYAREAREPAPAASAAHDAHHSK